VKTGGQIVYATCTLAPEEDEVVVDALLKAYPHAAAIESVENLVTAPALTHDGDLQFDASVPYAVRLWPHLYDTSGFFAALIRKHDAIEGTTTLPPQRTLKQAGFESITASQEQAVFDTLLDRYGFQLRSILERQQLKLFARSQSVYAIPQALITHFTDFPCIAVGMLIGEWLNGVFVPSHELIARFSAQFTGQRFTHDGEHVKQWLQGLDLRSVMPPYPTGNVILIEDDRQRFIGRGKVLRDRLRNLSPKK
jgi:16S rRNA (cytosine1407-C5)-methyltransferase